MEHISKQAREQKEKEVMQVLRQGNISFFLWSWKVKVIRVVY